MASALLCLALALQLGLGAGAGEASAPASASASASAPASLFSTAHRTHRYTRSELRAAAAAATPPGSKLEGPARVARNLETCEAKGLATTRYRDDAGVIEDIEAVWAREYTT